jgi:hypothetical protein
MMEKHLSQRRGIRLRHISLNSFSFLALFNAKATPRAGPSLRSSGEPVFELYNKEGKTRATVDYTELQHAVTPEERSDEQPVFSMFLFDEKGKIVWGAR